MEFAKAGMPLKPNDNGELQSFLDFVRPEWPLEWISVIKKLAIVTPDLSQAVHRAITLGNPGLDWEIEGVGEQAKGVILSEIEDWFDGQPGLINNLFRQVLMSGALSAEYIPDKNFSSVLGVVIVSTEDVRFLKVENEDGKFIFVPYQLQKSGMPRKLNSNQYTYEALEQDEKSPYAIHHLPVRLIGWELSIRPDRAPTNESASGVCGADQSHASCI